MAINAAVSKGFSAEIDTLRSRFNIPKDFKLKFNPGPDGLSHEKFIELKQLVIEVAAKYRSRIFMYVILHDIATNPDEARRNGINTVCFHFNGFLTSLSEPGLVLIDRFNDEGNEIDAHLKEKYSVGVTGLPFGTVRLENIVGFHYSAIGQSNFPSVVDIVLGSIRFAINAHTRNQQENLETAKKLLKLLSPLFHRGQLTSVTESSFCFRPKLIKSDNYRLKYQALKDFLAEGGISTSQAISA